MGLTRHGIFTLNRIPYFIHPQTIGAIAESSIPRLDSDWTAIVSSNDSSAAKPVTLVNLSDLRTDLSSLPELGSLFASQDDVYSPEFASVLVLHAPSKSTLDIRSAVSQISSGPGQRFHEVFTTAPDTANLDIPSGPYFLSGRSLHQAWRLYPDNLGAFVSSVVPDNVFDPKRFSVLQAVNGESTIPFVAVPSRLYGQRTESKPLAGYRISVKDNMDLAGTKTTLMNRAYSELYEQRNESAEFITDLVAKGAVVVGKTKLCAFASAEEPTDQWIDYHCPFNPRGDTYQSPSGSTTGGAVALAGYDWLDASVGTDTTGSIRAPATCCGLYALRSSFGSASIRGIAARCRAFDTIGLLERDLETLKHLARNVLNVSDYTQFPKRIIYPLDFFPHGNLNQQTMVDEFVGILEKFLGIQRTEIDIKKRWEQCPPLAAGGKPLKEYLSKSAFWPMYYDLYHETDAFRDDYRKTFQKEVYVGPYVRWSWELAKDVTAEQKQQGLAELKVFREWFGENILQEDRVTGSDAVMIMPSGRAVPKYRDDPNGPPGVIGTFTENYFASILELPQLILPIGQNAYESRVSGQTEHRPIVGSIVGAQGSDLMLISLAKAAFEAVGWPATISTGRYMFELGDNARNVKGTRSVL